MDLLQQFKLSKKPKDKRKSLRNLLRINRRKQMRPKSWLRKLLKRLKSRRSLLIILTRSISYSKKPNRRQERRHSLNSRDFKKSRMSKRNKRDNRRKNKGKLRKKLDSRQRRKQGLKPSKMPMRKQKRRQDSKQSLRNNSKTLPMLKKEPESKLSLESNKSKSLSKSLKTRKFNKN